MKESIILILAFLIFTILTVAGSRRAYYRQLQREAVKLLAQEGYKPGELYYPLQEMMFSISLPNHEPVIQEAAEADFRYEVDLGSWLYPSLLGVRVVLKQKKGPDLSIAYQTVNQYRASELDQMLQQGRINSRQYERIASAALVQPGTARRILEHVYRETRSKV